MSLGSPDDARVIGLPDALDMVYELAERSFPDLPDNVLRDFSELIIRMAGESGQLSLRELLNATENLSLALREGDHTLLAQPRGLRTERIVDVVEFAESKFFLGQRGYVRPKILENLWELFHGEAAEHRLEVVLGGGIGWGKSYMSGIALGYMLYKLSCYYSPQVEYGLAPGSSIYFVMQSVTESLAKKVLFGNFAQMLRASEYFSRYFPYDPGIQSELRFPNSIGVLPLSSTNTAALGLNVFGGILDELNFMARVSRPSSSRFTGEQEYDQADKLYTTVVRRMKSRFSVRGKVPGKVMLISSANYPGDFIDRKIREAEAEEAQGVPGSVFIVRFPQWGTFPPDRVSPERFLVEVGDETRSSRILSAREDASDPDAVIEVPVDYRAEFDADLEAAIRDLAGIPVGGVCAFIKRRETIEAAAKTHTALFDGEQLFLRESVDLSQFSGRLQNLLNPRYLEMLADQPAAFFASADLALSSDSCGLAVCHCAGTKLVGKSTRWDEEKKSYVEAPAGEEPVVVVDGLLEIVPPAADQIDLTLVGDLLELLNARLPMELVSADSFQSAMLLQRMRKLRTLRGKRLRAGVLSVDANAAPYFLLRQALREERLVFPAMDRLKRELRELMYDDRARKIDHPPTGSKDVSDAMTACTYLCMLRHSRQSLSGTAGRKLLAGIDAPDAPGADAPRRPRGSGRRIQ